MAAVQLSNSPPPGPSRNGPRDRIADALYAWCRESHEVGHVFNQTDLLSAGIIPDQDLQILLTATTYLVRKNLFKVHDLKAGGGIGWELISQERAANYAGLSRDEHLVYSCIDSMGAAGIWTKTIKNRLQAHAKVLERVYKSLESKGLIKPMKSVKNPGRKMFIVAGLQPSEEATGGAWFTEGILDVGLMQTISEVAEHYVSTQSWREVDIPNSTNETSLPPSNKRKAPHDGFEDASKTKTKMSKIDDDRPRSESPEMRYHKSKPKPAQPKAYEPFPAGHDGYPTLREITRGILRTKVTATILPENAIGQLLKVMVYDNRLFKMHRLTRGDEVPDNAEAGTITMYRCFRTPADILQQRQVAKRQSSDSISTRKAAVRQEELEDIGRGGSSEVPCMSCPVFDLCGDGGPVNVVTCQYFDQWFQKTADADAEAGQAWPGYSELDKYKSKSKPPQQPNGNSEVKYDPDIMEIT